jgi:hypothetical protein
MNWKLEQPHVGDVVIFTDEHGIDHNALVTAVFGEVTHFPADGEDVGVRPGSMPCLNAVWVSGNEEKQDPYGRQIERDHTSIVHATYQPAHGVYWRWPGEPKNPIVEPTEK